MKVKTHFGVAVILLALALCGMAGFSACTTPTIPTTPVVDNASAQRAIFTAKESYGVAESLAIVYARLPRCAAPPVQPCSDQAVLDQITKSRNIARAALDAGESAVRNPAFGADVVSTAVASAQAAMGSFTAITAAFSK